MDEHTITASVAKEWLDHGEAVLIDVREPSEHASLKIDHALLCPLGLLKEEDLPPSDKKIIIHCQKGRRGEQAVRKLLGAGSKRVLYNMEGGIEAWVRSGFDTISSANKVLPLDRQVQLILGVLILFLTGLSFFITPKFLILVALIGLGLINAGMTGWCGLGKLVLKMPWNR